MPLKMNNVNFKSCCNNVGELEFGPAVLKLLHFF